MKKETLSPIPWMTWLIGWISRRTLCSAVLVISNTLQRSLWKTCGLFNTGFAGDVDFITSPGLDASDAFSAFGLTEQGLSQNPGVSGLKSNSDQLKNLDSWNELNDLDDLSDDPLGDDTMETFMNLDQFLDENSLFDEYGNLNVPGTDSEDNSIVPKAEAEVAPVINFDLSPQEMSAIPSYIQVEPATSGNTDNTAVQTGKTVKKRSRKRPAPSSGGVKTSLFEIPETVSAMAAEFVVDNNTDFLLLDSELDHDYSTKRQRVSVTSGDVSYGIKTEPIDTPQQNTSKSCAAAEGVNNEKGDKQAIRRQKNNVASKRSREQRKKKFVEYEQEADELVVKNQALREKIVELERLAKEMKAVLVAKMTGK